ncbi:protein kinase domain protein [Stylonychia lemnae]|uniref:Protein kinase domain protein n=1 Tax=Stylonychia lemnae TaxID=5949 RepID=A0A078ALV3_STYLE|nr:protein kinase domain protein [Stylonychia lemnae]|eukprot:CDW83345.1 protein kinase domain protein [Stylonychia lemnae]
MKEVRSLIGFNVLVEEMKERNSHLDDMDYVEMDLTEPMDLLDSDSFTCIIDKGTLDSVACSEQYSQRAKQMVENVHRILAPGGSYICVSYARPETRLIYLKDPNFKWKVDTNKIAKKSSIELFERLDQEQFYYVYICTKNY